MAASPLTQSASSRMLLAAGLLTWAIMAAGWLTSGGLQQPHAPLAAILWVVFPIGFWRVAAPRYATGALGTCADVDGTRIAALGIQVVTVLALTGLGTSRLAGVLLAVIAGQAPLLLPLRGAFALLLAQTAAFGALSSLHTAPRQAAFGAIGFFGFQLFATGAAWLARREAQARQELARVHSELLATQSLLADTARGAERLRISRELHDSVGHHLTALTLQLEVAKNTAAGNEAVLRAQEIARAMLGEVRGVVGALREEQEVDLRRAIDTLIHGVSQPRVHVEYSEAVPIRDGAIAHALFRCVQEGLTNALRHAGARNVWITLAADGASARVHVRDDGRGVQGAAGGHGLVGLRERLSQLGGTVHLERPEGGGAQLRAEVPLPGGTS